MKRKPKLIGAAYVGVLLSFMVFYSFIPGDFYHSTIELEKEVTDLKKDIEIGLSKSIADTIRHFNSYSPVAHNNENKNNDIIDERIETNIVRSISNDVYSEELDLALHAYLTDYKNEQVPNIGESFRTTREFSLKDIKALEFDTDGVNYTFTFFIPQFTYKPASKTTLLSEHEWEIELFEQGINRLPSISSYVCSGEIKIIIKNNNNPFVNCNSLYHGLHFSRLYKKSEALVSDGFIKDLRHWSHIENVPTYEMTDTGKPNEVSFSLVVSPSLYNNIVEYTNALNGKGEGLEGKLARMFYLSAVTITTTGYGDIVPITTRSRIAVALESILGIFLIGLFINAIFSNEK